ncbi:MAG: DUF4214 domain-containing protein [Saccharofermentans sp.]|nr:DUF4214 domain-containing protein [Saccharofermentans sp.]
MKNMRLTKIITTIVLASFVFIFAGNSVNAQTREEYVGGFVERMYTMVLGRESEEEGYNYWVERILSGDTTGASCAYGFFMSREYTESGATDEQYVRTLYAVMLGRECDDAGLQYWLSYLMGGTPRTYVLAGFVNSAEYEGICGSFGISRGTLNMDPAVAHTSTAGMLSQEGDGLYMNDFAGNRMTGWQRQNGYRYYFDPAHGGRAATGWTWIDGLKYYFDDEHHLIQDVHPIIGRQDSYLVTVNCATQTVMVYAQDVPGGAYNVPVRAMVCSTGAPGHGTIQGTYPITQGNRWGLLFDGPDNYVYGQYVSIISGNYLFHSSWYYTNGDGNTLSVREYNRLGTPSSHGCVRMSVGDCRWIWENCASNNSTVRIYTADEPAPFDRPAVIPPVVVSGDMGHDPTDI